MLFSCYFQANGGLFLVQKLSSSGWHRPSRMRATWPRQAPRALTSYFEVQSERAVPNEEKTALFLAKSDEESSPFSRLKQKYEQKISKLCATDLCLYIIYLYIYY